MLKEQVQEFLAQKRIAVAGVSSTKPDAANLIYQKLRDNGYEVYAINPKVDTVEGDPCYPDVRSTPQPPEAVVIATTPAAAEQIAHDCVEVGVKHVWMHHSISFLPTSVSDTAVAYCQQNGIEVIAGGCPMMFVEPVDFGHKCMKVMSRWTGVLPK